MNVFRNAASPAGNGPMSASYFSRLLLFKLFRITLRKWARWFEWSCEFVPELALARLACSAEVYICLAPSD